MGTVEFAKEELKLAGLLDKDSDYNGMLGEAVLELMEVFSKQGHSGSSAPAVVSLFKELALYRPINPINNTEDEWIEVGTDFYQNRRMSAIFKDGKNDKPYYLDAIIWELPNGVTYTGTVEGIRSRQYCRFPFFPKSFFVQVTDEKEPKIIDKSELDAVFIYYDKYE